MAFELHLERSLALELDLSFSMLIKPPSAKLAKYLYVGSDWTEAIDASLLNEASGLQSSAFLDYSSIFAWQSPYKEDLQHYINWLKELSISEMYTLLSPFMGEGNHFPFDMEKHRDQYVFALEKWYKGYFKRIADEYADPIRDYVAGLKKKERGNPEEFLEEVTGGLVIDSSADIKTVVLFPNFHFRPIFTSCVYANIAFASFPPQLEDGRDYDMEWLTSFGKAISDEIRVKILQLLSGRKVTFSELAKEIGSTKANIHHHLLILRVAKLLRLYETGDKHTYGYYSLRPTINETASAVLGKILY